jgi:hypothetical protein
VSPAEGFWERCIDRLSEEGLIAVNWAEFAGDDGGRAEAEKLARLLPSTLYITPSGRRDNLIQFASEAPLPDPDAIDAAMPGAARLQRPRSTLSRCTIATHWPR